VHRGPRAPLSRCTSSHKAFLLKASVFVASQICIEARPQGARKTNKTPPDNASLKGRQALAHGRQALRAPQACRPGAALPLHARPRPAKPHPTKRNASHPILPRWRSIFSRCACHRQTRVAVSCGGERQRSFPQRPPSSSCVRPTSYAPSDRACSSWPAHTRASEGQAPRSAPRAPEAMPHVLCTRTLAATTTLLTLGKSERE